MHLSVEELIHYTDEERTRWERWFRENGEEMLRMPIAGERETTVGQLILHVFGPELRYIQRLRGEVLSEYRDRPTERIGEVFGFGLESRKAMRAYIASITPMEWSRNVSFEINGVQYQASVRKIIFHALMHEVRHWAQVARIMRDRGFAPPGSHDLLTSTALF